MLSAAIFVRRFKGKCFDQMASVISYIPLTLKTDYESGTFDTLIHHLVKCVTESEVTSTFLSYSSPL